MTDSECPACGCISSTFWSEMDSWVCDECFVAYGTSDHDSKFTKLIQSFDENSQHDTSLGDDWRQQVSVRDSSEANLVDVLSMTEDLCRTLSLPDDVVLRAAELVTEAWKSNFMHGRTKPATVAAATYIASRETEFSVPLGVLAQNAEVDERTVMKTYQKLRAEVEVDISPPAPTEYVDYICLSLNLPDPVSRASKQFLNDHGTVPGNPTGIAAAGVYEVAKRSNDVTLNQLAGVVSLTKETVWRHAVTLRE